MAQVNARLLTREQHEHWDRLRVLAKDSGYSTAIQFLIQRSENDPMVQAMYARLGIPIPDLRPVERTYHFDERGKFAPAPEDQE